MLNCPEFQTVRILSHFECNVTSHVAVYYFDGLIPIAHSLSSDAFIQTENAPNTFSAAAVPQIPWGAYNAPPDP